MEAHDLKLNIGSGRILIAGHLNIDIMQYVDGNGTKLVDIIRDFENQGLPFCDNSCDEIVANSVLEHIGNLELLLNECHRVLKPTGKLTGKVPNASDVAAFKDPTHKRFFLIETFSYFVGTADHNPDLPSLSDNALG